jgi:hypothetical protein
VNKELAKMWKEEVIAEFELLFQQFPGEMDEKAKTLETLAGLRTKI